MNGSPIVDMQFSILVGWAHPYMAWGPNYCCTTAQNIVADKAVAAAVNKYIHQYQAQNRKNKANEDFGTIYEKWQQNKFINTCMFLTIHPQKMQTKLGQLTDANVSSMYLSKSRFISSGQYLRWPASGSCSSQPGSSCASEPHWDFHRSRSIPESIAAVRFGQLK